MTFNADNTIVGRFERLSGHLEGYRRPLDGRDDADAKAAAFAAVR